MSLTNSHARAFVKLLDKAAYQHRRSETFRDVVETSALSIQSPINRLIDPPRWEKREERYHQIRKRYREEEFKLFPELFARIVLGLEELQYWDFFGPIVAELKMVTAKELGQFFTPYEVCRVMAGMILQGAKELVEERGFITIHEPACGAGAMVIACAASLYDQGLNPQKVMHATCVDIEPTAVHMAFVQLSLLHIPAVVIHGNSLTMEEWSRWETPAHFWGFWQQKLDRQQQRNLGEPLVLTPG